MTEARTTAARLVPDAAGGLRPEGAGWFVLNAEDAGWFASPELGASCAWEGEGDARFPQLGVNLNALQPGQPMTMYHREDAQEDFLVLHGECVAIVEGEERVLRRWDLLHCPAGTAHAVVGAGSGPSLVLAVGARTGAEDDGLVYPADPVALAHGAAPAEETSDPKVAYAPFTFGRSGYVDGWLP
jgi:uncharacterized cupin superfamily protein